MTDDTTKTNTRQIAALNDKIRRQAGVYTRCVTGEGLIVYSQGVVNLPIGVLGEICIRVRTFDDFTDDNDPKGERNSGSFAMDGAGAVVWTIDYYARDMNGPSEDPADPDKTVRVLTVMLAGEG